MRRALLAIAVALVATTALVLPADAAPGDAVATGWWSRNPGQSAPEGGGAVAHAPDGVVTVAAVRIDTGASGLASAVLTLVETGGVGQTAAGMVACRVGDAWEAEAGGALDDAPATSCDDGIVLERDGEASTWSADITRLVVDATGMASIALVPAPGDEPLAPPFDVRFATPTVDAVAQQPPADDFQSGFDGGSSPPGDGGATTEDRSPAFTPAPSSSGFDPSPLPNPSPGEPTPAAPGPPQPAGDDAAAAGDDTSADDEAAFTPLVPTVGVAGDDQRTVGRAISYVVISALAGVAVGVGSRLSRMRFGAAAAARG